jgi:hypothetical protein
VTIQRVERVIIQNTYKLQNTQKNANTDKYLQKTLKTLKTLKLSCDCRKSYKHRQSLYAHKKNCKYETECFMKNEIAELKNMILNLSKNNAIMLLNSHDTNNKICSNNTNSFTPFNISNTYFIKKLI